MSIKRRHFLQGCCAGIVAMNGARVGGLVFAQTPGSTQRDILVSVFLRGGMDSLSFLVPHADGDYATARGRLKMSTSQVLDIDGYFGLHPSAVALKDLMDSNHLAVVCACGSPSGSRSHFEAQDYMERGKPDDDGYYTGWLARHLTDVPSESIFQAVSRGSTVATALEGFPEALALSSAQGFTLQGSSSQKDDLRRALRRMYAADPDLGFVAARTLDAGDVVDYANPSTYTPGHGVTYPNTGFASSMASVAQLIRLDLGLQAATVDYGGWDTHETQASSSNPTTGYFSDRITELSQGLNAFWSDLADFHGRITLVVMSEFGRRLRENDNTGTDHGHGSVMLVMSSNLAHGGIYGQWPGLGYDQLFEHVDLHVTTDFRTVLAEIMLARMSNSNLGGLFPGFTYPGPVGLFGTAGNFPSGPTRVLVR